MTTEAQRIASRANGAKSHGPVTLQGKAVSRLNALRHGVYSEVTLIEGEHDADLVAFGKRLRADLAPVGEVELMLADKVVSTAWRLRRIVAVEADLYDSEETSVSVFAGSIGDRILRMSRHEATLERSLYRALHELQRLQAARKGADVAPPAVLEVTLSSGDALGSFRQGNEIDGECSELRETDETRAFAGSVNPTGV